MRGRGISQPPATVETANSMGTTARCMVRLRRPGVAVIRIA
jgi:hypothetical protein